MVPNDFFATQPDASYARDFLANVVPWGSGYVTVHWHRPGLGMPGRSFQTIDAALAFVTELKATQFNIYFCTSSQKLNSGHRDRESDGGGEGGNDDCDATGPSAHAGGGLEGGMWHSALSPVVGFERLGHSSEIRKLSSHVRNNQHIRQTFVIQPQCLS